jgi:hypothetical protein
MGENPYKKVDLVECGSRMMDPTGKPVHNTCFFNSLQEELRLHGSEYAACSFSDFLALGGWKRSFAGQMVDTYAHAANIERLAQALGVKIHVYSEIIPGVTNSTIYSPFGSQGVTLRICRCYNFQHFKRMSFNKDQNMLAEQRRRAEEAEARRLEALHAQAAADTIYVKTLIEEEKILVTAAARRRAEAEERRRAEEAEVRRLDALHAQAAADATLALALHAKEEARHKQEREDRELARLLAQQLAA